MAEVEPEMDRGQVELEVASKKQQVGEAEPGATTKGGQAGEAELVAVHMEGEGEYHNKRCNNSSSSNNNNNHHYQSQRMKQNLQSMLSRRQD